MSLNNESGFNPETKTTPTKESVITLLDKYGIDHGSWGQGESRTLDRLLKELQSGEAELIEEKDRLLRRSYGVGITVTHADETGTYVLIEDKQVYKDGRERRRADDLQMSIGEKMKPGEDAREAAGRAFKEELDITASIPLANEVIHEKDVPSKAFPGLHTNYITTLYTAELPEEFYKPEGYVEEQEDKTNYYIWKKQ